MQISLQLALGLSLLASMSAAASLPHFKVISFEVEGYGVPDIRDMNENGDFVAIQREGENTWPFFWKRDNIGNYTYTKIDPAVPGYQGDYTTESDLFINDNGQIAGTYHGSSILPFSWSQSGGFTGYSGIPAINTVYTRMLTEGGRLVGAELYDSSYYKWDFGLTSYSQLGATGYRVNDPSFNDSKVVAFLRHNTNSSNAFPAVSNNLGQFVSLTSLGATFTEPENAYPTYVSENDTYVGYNLVSGARQAWYWDGVSSNPLTIPTPNGEMNTELIKINSNDIAIGHADDRPIVWNLDGLFLTGELKTAYDPSQVGQWSSLYSGVTDINNTDQIVGYAGLPEGYDFAVLWDNGTPYDMNEISAVGFDRVVVEATKITDSGYVLAKGYSEGKYVSFILEPTNDLDGDQIADWWEYQHASAGLWPNSASDASLDYDGDNLTNLEEYRLGTNPELADTDGDLMSDSYELSNFLDPLDPSDTGTDFDNDGLNAWFEYIAGELIGLSVNALPQFESPVDMGVHPGYNFVPEDTNENAEVVGWYDGTGNGESYAFYWSQSEVSIVTLDSGTELSPSAEYISDDGIIAGNATHEYLWYDDDDGEWIPGTHDVALIWSSPAASASVVERPIEQGHEYKDAGHRAVGFSFQGELILEVDKRADTVYDKAYFTWAENLGASHFLDYFNLNGHRIAVNSELDTYMVTPFRRSSSWADDFRPFEFLYRPFGLSEQSYDAFTELGVRYSFEVQAGNSKGQAVGQADGRPFIFNQGSLSHLSVEAPTQYGTAHSINEYGAIAGESESPDGYVAATLWYPGSAAMELNYLIPPGSGWDLISATAINNSGHIVGYGVKQGEEHQYRGFLLKAVSQDDDNDGLSNDWETLWAYMLGYSDGQMSFWGDSDGDKLSNYLEFILGTYVTASELDGSPVFTDSTAYSSDADVIIVVGNQIMEVKEDEDISRLKPNYHR